MRKRLIPNKLTSSLLVGLAVVTSGQAQAAGFALTEQNARGLGVAYAGMAAQANDPGDLFFNPAVSTLLDGTQISGSAFIVSPQFKFTDEESTVPGAFRGNSMISAGAKAKLAQEVAAAKAQMAAAAAAGVAPTPEQIAAGAAKLKAAQDKIAALDALSPTYGATASNKRDIAAIPSFSVSHKINHEVGVGLSVNVPFGLATEFDNDWAGKFHSISFDMKTINVNPSVSYQVNPSLSVGLGLNVQYMHAIYEKAQVLPAGTQDVNGLPVPFFASGTAKVDLSNWSYGVNLGAFFKPSDNTSFGISWRSGVKHRAKGNTVISLPTGAKVKGQARATATLPASASLSVYQRVSPKVELLADATWTGWGTLQELSITSALPAPFNEQVSTLNLKFRDTWRVSLGGRFQINDKLKLSTGVAWDQSPVSDAKHRLASLPDNNRTWLSLGAQYKYSKNMEFNVGYAYLLVPKSKVNNNNENPNVYGTLKGTFSGSGHVLGAQVSYKF